MHIIDFDIGIKNAAYTVFSLIKDIPILIELHHFNHDQNVNQ